MDLYLPTMLGSNISIYIKKLGVGVQSHITYLARAYGHDELADKLLKVFNIPNNNQWQLYAWIRRGNLEKVAELLDPDNVDIERTAEEVVKNDNLEMFKIVRDKMMGENLEQFTYNCLKYSIYGSQIFSHLSSGKLLNSEGKVLHIVDYLMLLYKTYFDFAGINYLLERLTEKERTTLFKDADDGLAEGEAHAYIKVYDYFKLRFQS